VPRINGTAHWTQAHGVYRSSHLVRLSQAVTSIKPKQS
jgi:hypothetical protein